MFSLIQTQSDLFANDVTDSGLISHSGTKTDSKTLKKKKVKKPKSEFLQKPFARLDKLNAGDGLLGRVVAAKGMKNMVDEPCYLYVDKKPYESNGVTQYIYGIKVTVDPDDGDFMSTKTVSHKFTDKDEVDNISKHELKLVGDPIIGNYRSQFVFKFNDRQEMIKVVATQKNITFFGNLTKLVCRFN